MLAKIIWVVVLIGAVLIGLKIMGFIFSIVWKIGLLAIAGGGLYLGWRLLRRGGGPP